MQRLRSDNPRYKDLLNSGSARSGGHSLDSMIHAPVQRLPRYVLLVSQPGIPLMQRLVFALESIAV